MAKQRRLPPPARPTSPSGALYQRELDAARVLMERGNHEQAFELLADLADRYPARTDILLPLLDTAHQLGYGADYAVYAEELLVQEPDHPEVLSLLGGAYILQGFLALGISTVQQFLDRYPNHPGAADAQRILDTARQVNAAQRSEWPFELLVRDERIRLYTDRGEYAAARREAQSVLKANPAYTPALLSLSHVEFQRGLVKDAAALAARALEIDANDLDALCMLVHYCRILGNDPEAREYAERLRRVDSADRTLHWLRLAEASSYFGDDEAVLQAGMAAGLERRGPKPDISPFLYHLVAVAAQRRGDSKRARRLWRRALELDPGLDIAADNLDDLDRPAGERNGPWAFHTDHWIGEALVDEMAETVGKFDEEISDKQVRREVERLLGRRPELRATLPILMRCGDPYGCGTAAMMAGVTNLPELRAALVDFVSGSHGPDEVRSVLAEELARKRDIVPGITTLWRNGKPSEVLLLGITVDDEPRPSPLSKPVQALAEQANLALESGRIAEAEQKFRAALTLQPDLPPLRYSLAFCALQAGRPADAEALFRSLVDAVPDFIFGHIGLAIVHLSRHEPEKAEAAIAPLRQKSELHVVEFSTLCQAEVDILLSQGKRSAARLWAEAWSGMVDGVPSFNELIRIHQRTYGG